MSMPWDRAAPGYLEQWVPRILPYHQDLIEELDVQGGERVLVPTCGPGAEAILLARRTGEYGHVRATDRSAAMLRLAEREAKKAGTAAHMSFAQAPAANTDGAPYHAIACAFGLWQLSEAERDEALAAWAAALAPHGKLGLITWGPYEPDNAFERLSASLHQLEPDFEEAIHHRLAEKPVIEAMLAKAGLSILRFRVVRHTHTFETAEQFVHSLRDACTWRAVWDALGDERAERVAAHFYNELGGREVPVVLEPAATLILAAKPGDEVRVRGAQSVRVLPSS